MSNTSEPLRVLLIGASGQVGHAWQAMLEADQIVAMPDRKQLDLCQGEALGQALQHLIDQSRPNLIVNAAAYTAVDRAEQEPELAFQINADAPGVLAKVAARNNMALIHYSTDYVFDGHGEQPFSESDPTGPLSVYGRSKLAGEANVSAAAGNSLIFRTSWVFGAHGQNFLKTMLKLAQTRDELRVVNDQFGAPTPASLLAQLPLQLPQHQLPSGYLSRQVQMPLPRRVLF
jgi:dTDP-4-dehydrorhamnose reductase